MLILDCCFSGAAGNAFFRSGIDDQLNIMSHGRGIYVMTASTAILAAQEKEGDDYGLFTKHLIRGIGDGEADRDGDGWVTIDELYDYAHRGVVREGAQKPMKWSLNVEGEIRIASSGRSSRQERARKLKALLFDLNSAGSVPNELYREALDVIDRNRQELTDIQRLQDALLDQFLQGKLLYGELTWKWGKLQSLPQHAPKKAALFEQWSKMLPALDLAEYMSAIRQADEKLTENIGHVRRFGRRVGDVMVTGQFSKFWEKKSD